ncbi:glycosyl transferase [Marinobacterium zhoushanense]|uniref:Glycosyl transferase n=1 Tax=Marinobacterium zhoushanense TaxID=1679163 RepID=A0ABQ1KUA6_9GAMM|nr:MJ1255/VC2487 family glycosyltransferase [Marinobacterium zhoushanense]GGC08696.1 glycosyl transferase [Marinobacterium zhoushanense]
MRILYGVQGTGNGHITRARVMSKALACAGVEVDYLFSGRAPERFFNMEPFGDFRVRRGLTFYTDAGKVQLGRTLIGNSLVQLWRDARALDLSDYDLVVTDFEPVTAWAAKLRGVPSVGIAHQYAFCYRVPGSAAAPWLKPALGLMAPVAQAIGVHWHHFDAPILPPLIEPPAYPLTTTPGEVLVYLPFESLDAIRYALLGFPECRFLIYAGVETQRSEQNLVIKPFSRDGFQRDLASCDGVIANAGFGLCSEAIQAGKKLLVKPLANQVEQAANATALSDLGRAVVMTGLETGAIGDWLGTSNPAPLPWPDTASALVAWLLDGCREPVASLSQRVWAGHLPELDRSVP